jgi:DNA (cytosine-5)-methyltransferase 1
VRPRIGELFAGYGGLGMGVRDVLGGEVAWVSDVCKFDKAGHAVGHHSPCRAPCSILAHRFPGVPNVGDVSKVDWSQVEPVDVLTGGFPCQDISSAGKRRGMRPDTRSGLWTQMAYAIDQLRPSLVVIENVRSLTSAQAHSDVEPCPWCVGDDPDGALRALGAVLGDLADLGYDAVWHGLRAADVGAPHGRFRIFIVAYPQGDPRRLLDGDFGAAAVASRIGHERGGHAWGGGAGPENSGLLPTPTGRDGKGRNQRDDDTCLTGALLPTPACNDMGEGKTPDAWDKWTARMKAEHSNGNGNGPSLAIEAQRLLPTPVGGDARNSRQSTALNPRSTSDTLSDVNRKQDWGKYVDAIARWEALTRPAPPPTETGPKGAPRLNPAFSEFLMGLPDGWVTDVPGITRNEALKALGNGVVPQQAEAALRHILAVIAQEAVA